MTKLEDFVRKYSGKTFRVWYRKRPGINYSASSEECEFSTLVGAYEIGSNDWLLALENLLSDGKKYVEFCRLSEIDLNFSDGDQDDE